ncbi:MAG: cupin domain-containing protein [Gemmatimonadetes bacterium]|nr:cupin domain-containing protein [Gemmatimonadota bacterium]
MKPIRRVVTGHDAAGRSAVLFDGQVRAGPDLESDLCLWVTDETPARVTGQTDAAARKVRLEPPAQGSVFRFVEFPPESALAELSAEQIEGFMAGLFKTLEAMHTRVDTTKGPGMHRTRTVDYVVLLSGEITLVLDEGEVTLKPFDVVVQRGTNHGWVNRGVQPALLAIAMIDGEAVSK